MQYKNTINISILDINITIVYMNTKGLLLKEGCGIIEIKKY